MQDSISGAVEQPVAVETTNQPQESWAADIAEHTKAPQEQPADVAETNQTTEEKPKKSQKTNGWLRKLGRAEGERDAAIAREQALLEKLAQYTGGSNKADSKNEHLLTSVTDEQGNTVNVSATLENGEPNPAAYKHTFDYIKDLQKFQLEQTLCERDKKSQEKAESNAFRQDLEKKADIYRSSLQEFEKSNPGAAGKISEAEEAGLFPDPLVLLTLQTENPVEIASYLSNNLAELQALNQMNAQQARLAIAKLEGKLSVQRSQPTVTRQTNTPPPVKPLKTGSSGGSREYAEMSLSELDKHWKPLR